MFPLPSVTIYICLVGQVLQWYYHGTNMSLSWYYHGTIASTTLYVTVILTLSLNVFSSQCNIVVTLWCTIIIIYLVVAQDG